MNATDEWYETERLTDHSYRIAEGSMFNTYLIVGDERALQIDAGAGFGDLQRLVDGLVDVPVTLLLSHSHWDHMGAAHGFGDVLIDGRERHPDGRVTTDVVTDDFGYSPADFVADWRGAGRSFPDRVDAENFEVPPIEGVEAAADGDRIDLGGRTVELVGVPGHSPGQLAVLDRDEGVLYGADVLHNGYGLYIHFEGCDIHEYVATLERVIALRDEDAFDTLYLAHARPISGDDLAILDDYLDGLRAILDGDLEYEMTEEHPRARRYEVAGNPILTNPDLD